MAAKKEKPEPTILSASDIKDNLNLIVDDMIRIKELQQSIKDKIKAIVDGTPDDEGCTASAVRKAATAIRDNKIEELDDAQRAVMSLVDIYNDQ